MNGILEIDAFDFYDNFGFVVSEGLDELMRLQSSKPKPSVEWPDDLTEYDLSEPAFEPKEVVISGAMRATSKADFLAKYNSLWDLLSAPGERILRVVDVDLSFKAFYKANPLFKRLTDIDGASDIVVQLSIGFQIFDYATGFEPGSNGGFVQIKNQEGDVVALVQAPGEYEVIEFSGIQDDGSGDYQNSIIDNV